MPFSRVDTYVRNDGRWRLLSMAALNVPRLPEPARTDSEIYSEYAGTQVTSPELQVVVTREGARFFTTRAS